MSFTPLQFAIYSYIPSITGTMSVLGSSSIMYSIWIDRKKKLKNPQHRILFMMSFFDIMYSLNKALLWATYPKDTGILGAQGNELTCSIQGFFTEFCYAAGLYNAILSTFYCLTIRGMKQEFFGRYIEPYLHAFVCIVFFGFAIAGVKIQLFNASVAFCFVAPYPRGCTFIPTLECERYGDTYPIYYEIFGQLWIQISYVVIIVTNTLIWYTVYKQERLIATRYGKQALLRDEANKRNSTKGLSSRSSLRASIFKRNQSSDDNLQEAEVGEILEDKKDTTRNVADDAALNFWKKKQAKEQKKATYKYKRSKEVAIQSILFVFAFLLSWTFLTVYHLTAWFTGRNTFWTLPVVNTFLPLQGFFNAFVYARPSFRRIRRQGGDISFCTAVRLVFFPPKQVARRSTYYSSRQSSGAESSDFNMSERMSHKLGRIIPPVGRLSTRNAGTGNKMKIVTGDSMFTESCVSASIAEPNTSVVETTPRVTFEQNTSFNDFKQDSAAVSKTNGDENGNNTEKEKGKQDNIVGDHSKNDNDEEAPKLSNNLQDIPDDEATKGWPDDDDFDINDDDYGLDLPEEEEEGET